MPRVSAISKKLSKSVSSNFSSNTIWIIVAIFLVAIILFAVFFPRRFHSQCNPLVPENFSSYDYLMENLEGSGGAVDFSSSKPTLALFYANWCGHCNNFKPTWDEFSKSVGSNGPKYVSAIDVDQYPSEAQKHQVNSFPTVRYYPQGLSKHDNFVKYEGERTLDALKEFLGNQN